MSEEEVRVCEEEEPCPKSILFCGLAPDFDDEEDCIDDDSNPSGGANAVILKEKIWMGRQALKVFFMNEIPSEWTVEGKQLTIDQILNWANVWNPDGNEKIPVFKQTANSKKADIRVLFSEKEGCWSMVGMYAERVPKGDPTMALNLSHSYCNRAADQRSLVVHEFGHALGLEHEHQRSDFWEVLGKHLDYDTMSDDPRVTHGGSSKQKATFGKDWFKKKYGSLIGMKKLLGIKAKGESERLQKSEYDPDSIMHYGFDIDWLKDRNLRSMRAIDTFPDLSDKERRYIKGVHKRHSGLAKDPSKTDMSELSKAYGGGGS